VKLLTCCCVPAQIYSATISFVSRSYIQSSKNAVLHTSGTNTPSTALLSLVFHWRSSGVSLRNPQKLPQPASWTRAAPRRQLSTIASTSGTSSIAAEASITVAGLLARILASFQLKPSAFQEILSRRQRSLNVSTKSRHTSSTGTLRLHGIWTRP
jgi:hypothetical protein